MPLDAGTKLGLYESLSPLGVGGMGEVYMATDARLRSETVVKVLAGLHADWPGAIVWLGFNLKD